MPTQMSQKGKLLNGTVEWIGLPHPEASFLVRAFTLADLLPRRQGPLTDTDVALFVLGLLCSETTKDAPAAALRYGGFPCSSVTPGDLVSFSTIERLLPPIMTTALLPMLSAIIRSLAENAPFSVFWLRGTEPEQYSKFEICLRPDNGPDALLVYAPQSEISRRLRPGTLFTPDWPRRIKVGREMDGIVLEQMAKLTTADVEVGDRDRDRINPGF